MTIKNYAEAEAHLSKGRSKDCRPLTGRATSLERRGPDTIAVRYQATDVVTYHRDGRIVLDSGGWRTATTKERMCAYSPAIVGQSNGVWYIGRPWADEHCELYFDGATFDERGHLLNPRPAGERERLEAAKRKVDRMVAKYVRGWKAHLYEVREVERPSTGDCWYCLMRTEDGETLGDKAHSDHLLSHMEERYYVPSLLVNAIEERRYGGGVGFVVEMTNRDLQNGRQDRNALHMATGSLQAYLHRRKLALAELVAAREAGA